MHLTPDDPLIRRVALHDSATPGAIYIDTTFISLVSVEGLTP